GWLEVAVGTTVAAVVGYFSIKLLAQILAKRRFHVFAYYCWAVGASLLLWLAVS
ncbi:MAG: undecaprenyl-diphosphatase, partial [Methanobacteriota archaeon]